VLQLEKNLGCVIIAGGCGKELAVGASSVVSSYIVIAASLFGMSDGCLLIVASRQ
jgi:hypothetical protein